MRTDFLLLRSYGSENALARVQSDPLFAGLAKLGCSAESRQYKIGIDLNIPVPKYLVVHYDDADALHKAAIIKNATNCRVICLASDIYAFDHYRAIDAFVDMFVAPTVHHKMVLQSAVWNSVIVVEEAVDQIAFPNRTDKVEQSRDGKICWFGCPESYSKSMSYLLPKAFENAGFPLSNFEILTRAGCIVAPDLKHIPFEVDTFYRLSGGFTYSLLSHCSFDLHLNSWIKSPNKLITSIVRGLVPLFSATPNYMDLCSDYGLSALSYVGSSSLSDLLRRLNPEEDWHRYELGKVADHLTQRFSPSSMAHSFLNQV